MRGPGRRGRPRAAPHGRVRGGRRRLRSGAPRRRRGPSGGPARAADGGAARRQQVYLSARSWRPPVGEAGRWDARLGRRRNVLPRPEVAALLPDGGVAWHGGCAPAAGVDVVVHATGARAARARPRASPRRACCGPLPGSSAPPSAAWRCSASGAARCPRRRVRSPPACDGRARGAPRAGYHYTFDFLDEARVFTVRDNWCASARGAASRPAYARVSRAPCRRPGAACAAHALLVSGSSAPYHGPPRALRQGGAALPARVPAGLPLAGADRPALEGAGALRPPARGPLCERAARSPVRARRDERARPPRGRPVLPRRPARCCRRPAAARPAPALLATL